MIIKRFRYLLFFIFLVAAIILFAQDSKALLRGFGPDQYPDGKTYGIGVFFAPQDIKIYAEPKEDSELVEVLEWRPNRVQMESAASDLDDPRYSFIAFYPYDNVAIMAATDELDGWTKVIYDQKNKLSGWVKSVKDDKKEETTLYTNKFFSWLEFMNKFAKNHTIYFVSGVPKKYRQLRNSPSDDASPIAHELTYIKCLHLKHIRGNWMLVKAMDFNTTSPIGWLRWRDDDGRVLIFIDFIKNE